MRIFINLCFPHAGHQHQLAAAINRSDAMACAAKACAAGHRGGIAALHASNIASRLENNVGARQPVISVVWRETVITPRKETSSA